MTLVVGTAGHIDHGKTTLLRALTGIDADRLPEERRRGMTIDVGYAHLTTDDGDAIDFVDVPGHDRLVGNMLVGAGEIDAVMLVVAADDGPRAQTLEHLALLDALGITRGLAVVTKADAVPPERLAAVTAEVQRLLAPTSLAGSPVLPGSGATGEGLDAVRAALVTLRDRTSVEERPPTLAIDRAFSVKGRGAVVTGTLRGGPLTRETTLRLLPADHEVRIREIQVHGSSVGSVEAGGRTALNLGGVAGELARGMVVTADPDVVVTDRILAAFDTPLADRVRGRVHVHTAAVDGGVGRSGRDALTLDDGRAAGIVRLSDPVALRPGERFVLRRGVSIAPVGGVVLDARPPRGISRRRQTPDRVSALGRREPGSRLALHGLADGAIAADVVAAAEESMLAAIGSEAPVATARAAAARALRRLVTARRDEATGAGAAVLGNAVSAGRLIRDGDIVRLPGAARTTRDPRVDDAMDRLVVALDAPSPPSLTEAARQAGCPPEAIRELERTGRIVVLEPDLAYAMSAYRALAATALDMATATPLTPAAFRDATGTSRKYVMAILEDLDRRAILRRTPDGHIPGPKAPAATAR
ncbi:MAG TPA: selenocysteine-specific translation elongation factor [Candidatus Limnocylindrales bacterium]|nr:selenocysteine-specific translation elongation factor [Candidatus Limnocylindrales bacterium]